MEYDFENQIDSKYSTSSTPSSSASSTSESFMNQINNLKTKLTMQNQKQNQFIDFNCSMPNSCSLIFSTAASFNINQNDTVFYSRESIHLLAKFLANNSEQGIFRSLYSYAPDNLAWLWSFLDFDSPIDLSQVPVQERYEAFEWSIQDNNLSESDDELLTRVNKIFSDSPLIQYKYRENLMIADLFKFLEHLQKISFKYIAIALFNLYFPRFACFMDDQIRKFIKPKILAANLPLVKELDTMIVRLIKSRYSNLREYKQKILTGQDLPSYVRGLLYDVPGFWTNPANKLLVKSLTTGLNKPRLMSPVGNKANLNLNENMIHHKEEQNLYQTLSYLKMLQQSNKLNSDLDHTEEDLANLDEDDDDFKSLINSKFSDLSSPMPKLDQYFANAPNIEDGLKNFPSGQYTPISQNLANKLLINTPPTPTSFSPYLDSSSMWSSVNNKITQRYLSTATPPPSANLKNFDEETFMSPLGNYNNQLEKLMTPMNEEQFSRYFQMSANLNSPAPKTYHKDFSNYVGSNLTTPMNQNMMPKFNYDLNVKTHFNSARSPVSGARSPIYSNTAHSLPAIWTGRLPPKVYHINSLFSRKVFLGGLPWDVNQQYLLQLLHKYGSVKLEIPGKDLKHPRVSHINKMQERSTPGYVYIIFDHESAVQRLLADCRKEYKNGGEHYYYNILMPNVYAGNFNFNKRGKTKEVEVIPWNQDDTSYVPSKQNLPPKIDPKSTIFVGALHGMLNAQGLGKVMTEIFGEVIHAGLDTDKYKYPIGSGRVTFRNREAYVKAIKSRYLTIRANLEPNDPSPRFEKTIQIDPYLDDDKCSKCDAKSVYFCRNENCLDYFCIQCWSFGHDLAKPGEHIPLSRQNKPSH